MLWQLYKKIGNSKWVIDSVDTYKLTQQRLETLRASYRGQKVQFRIVEVEENEKYRKKLSDASWQGAGPSRPKRV
jgi:hypothetical protein